MVVPPSGTSSSSTSLAAPPARAPVIRKALFIYGPTGLFMRDDRCQAPVEGMTAQPNRAPLDLAYMAAMLERMKISCRITDYAAEKLAWKNFGGIDDVWY